MTDRPTEAPGHRPWCAGDACPDDGALLDAWSAGRGQPWADRCLLLARLVFGDQAHRRDWDEAQRAILGLAASRSDATDALVDCSTCGELVEVAVPITALIDDELAARRGDRTLAPLRVPTVQDMVDAAVLKSSDAAAALLAERCGLAEIPDGERTSAMAEFDETHPMLAPSVDVQCPACGGHIAAALDSVELGWGAVEMAAAVLVDDVIALAGAFGWSEADVLDVPPARRAVYRGLAEAGTGR